MNNFFETNKDNICDYLEQNQEFVEWLQEKEFIRDILCCSNYELVQMVAEQLAYELCNNIIDTYKEVA